MNTSTQICTCTSEGYSPECPLAFYQGGKILHELNGNDRLKPRRYEKIPDKDETPRATEENHKVVQPWTQPKSIFYDEVSSGDDHGEAFDDVETMLRIPDRSKTRFDEVRQKANLMDTDSLLANKRNVMRKFEPLSISGKTLTEISIGGYNVDVSKAAQKVSEIMPLPPAKLPRIYIDQEMNFNHHFFQGLERLIGRDQMLDIVSKTRYYTDDDLVLLPIIEEMIKSGYERKDTNLTVFTKSVLTSTFDLDPVAVTEPEQRKLIVGSNIWGFQYIEDGMECREVDLRMWLSVCYDRFRNIFFNTFKDSGMPAFAMEGVQTRYEPVRRYPTAGEHVAAALTNDKSLICYKKDEQYEYSDAGRTHRSRRRKDSKKTEPTIGGFLFGSRR